MGSAVSLTMVTDWLHPHNSNPRKRLRPHATDHYDGLRSRRHRSLVVEHGKDETASKTSSTRFFGRWKWVLIVLVVLLLIRRCRWRWCGSSIRRGRCRCGSSKCRRAPKVPLRYHWVPLSQIPEMFLKHLWISEDQRFFQHEGFDWKEMELAVKEAERKGKPVRGASTITNQCARSIFLWQGAVVRSERTGIVLHGLDGAAAAEAAHHGAVCERDRDGARDLRRRSRLAALFRRQRARSVAGAVGTPAAVLPNPKGWDPTKPSPMLRWRQRRILRREQNAHFPKSCSGRPA